MKYEQVSSDYHIHHDLTSVCAELRRLSIVEKTRLRLFFPINVRFSLTILAVENALRSLTCLHCSLFFVCRRAFSYLSFSILSRLSSTSLRLAIACIWRLLYRTQPFLFYTKVFPLDGSEFRRFSIKANTCLRRSCLSMIWRSFTSVPSKKRCGGCLA